MNEAQAVVALLALFSIKHFVFDFLLQKPFHYENKGTYGHPGGLAHAGLQALGTVIALWVFADLIWCLLMAMFDFLVHYHVDWAKTNINAKYGFTPTDEKFWWLLGLDQLLHSLTYVAIIGWTIGAF